MTAYGKLLFALVLVICLTSACRSKKPAQQASEPEPSSIPIEQADDDDEEEEEETSLEARCFEGDQEACDKLGH